MNCHQEMKTESTNLQDKILDLKFNYNNVLFLLGLKAIYKLHRLGNIEVHVFQTQCLLSGFCARFTFGNFMRKISNLGRKTQLP